MHAGAVLYCLLPAQALPVDQPGLGSVCRASGEQATSSATSSAFVRPQSRRTTAEGQPGGGGPAALPPAPSTRTAAAAVGPVQPQGRATSSSGPDLPSSQPTHLAQRSRLNQSVNKSLSPAEDWGAQGQRAAAASDTGAAVSILDGGVGSGRRLPAILEGTEESVAQEVPQYLQQQDRDLLQMALPGSPRTAPTSALKTASPAAAATVAGAESAASQHQVTAVPAAIPSPRAAAGAANRHFQAAHSSLGGYPRAAQQPDRAEGQIERRQSVLPSGAAPGNMSEAILPSVLMQLAEADLPQAAQQRASLSPRGPAQHRGESSRARLGRVGTAHQAELLPGAEPASFGSVVHGSQEDGRPSSNAAALQLQSSLVQTLTSTVESAMAQMRSAASFAKAFCVFRNTLLLCNAHHAHAQLESLTACL